ncbi:MAG: hypothetical protein K0S53_1914 [Bacteroidetes bacterium]|jgi:hypothetical protein|nr:hypothetical protein [Bacteroidota bacterium]
MRKSMKTVFKLLAVTFLFGGNTVFSQSRVFNGTIEDYTCGDDRCSFGIKKADGSFYEENITLTYDAAGKPKLSGEAQDIVIKLGENETLNPKYKGVKVSVACTGKNKIFYVTNIELKGPVQSATTVAAKTNDNSWEKYEGLYVFMNARYYSVGKFPENTVIHTQTGDKYFKLDKEHIGKYFLIDDKIAYKTGDVKTFAGGYIGAPVGNIITSIGVDGAITIQNYNNYGTKDGVFGIKLDGKGVNGKFEKRADGKYDLIINNARYVWTTK